MLRTIAIAVLVMTAAPLLAAPMQQDFDAAQALLDAGQYTQSRDAFRALNARFAATSTSRAATIVRARLGSALINSGDPDAAIPLLDAAIAGFDKPTPEDREEREFTRNERGRAEEAQGNLDAAAASYRAALATKLFPVDSDLEIALRVGLARTTIWSAPDESRHLLDGLLALPEARLKARGDNRALVNTLRGRVELNNGNPAEALRWFDLAARAAGGANTTKVNVTDVRIRGDLALAHFKLGHDEDVQRNVAFSGSGGLLDEGFGQAAAMPLPACAPATGLSPDAVAVVEFAIGDDGRVRDATPIYANRGSGVAADGDGPEILFPQVVRRWVWSLDSVAKLKGFWRQAIRVELRCFNQQPSTDPLYGMFKADWRKWWAGLGIESMPDQDENDAVALPAIRAELARREARYGKDSAQLFPPLNHLINNAAASSADRKLAFERQLRGMSAIPKPESIRIDLALQAINSVAERSTGRAPDIWRQKRDSQMALLAEIEPGNADTSRAVNLTRARLGETLEQLKNFQAATEQFERIVATPVSALSIDDPIRIAALLHLSNLAAGRHDIATAAATLAATGLSPDQCALIDVRPQPVNTVVGQASFPALTQRWGTGGFARIGYDITAAGKPANVRTIIASPPFVFGSSTEKAVARFEYRPVFRPGNTLGCVGNAQTVSFKVAG